MPPAPYDAETPAEREARILAEAKALIAERSPEAIARINAGTSISSRVNDIVGKPTFMGDVVPYVGGLTGSLAKRVGTEVKDAAATAFENSSLSGPTQPELTMAAEDLMRANLEPLGGPGGDVPAIPNIGRLSVEELTDIAARAADPDELNNRDIFLAAGAEMDRRAALKRAAGLTKPIDVVLDAVDAQNSTAGVQLQGRSGRGDGMGEIRKRELDTQSDAVARNAQIERDRVAAFAKAKAEGAVTEADEIKNAELIAAAARANPALLAAQKTEAERLFVQGNVAAPNRGGQVAAGMDPVDPTAAAQIEVDEKTSGLAPPNSLRPRMRPADITTLAPAVDSAAGGTAAGGTSKVSPKDFFETALGGKGGTSKERTAGFKAHFKDLLGVEDEDKAKEMWHQMSMIGFAIAAGQDPSALSNIAKGMLDGTKMMAAQRKEDRDRDDELTMMSIKAEQEERTNLRDFGQSKELLDKRLAASGAAKASTYTGERLRQQIIDKIAAFKYDDYEELNLLGEDDKVDEAAVEKYFQGLLRLGLGTEPTSSQSLTANAEANANALASGLNTYVFEGTEYETQGL